MRVPTTGTSVFSPLAVTNSTSTFNTTGFPIDLQFQSLRAGLTGNAQVVDRLRGLSSDTSDSAARFSGTSSTNAESSPGFGTNFNNTGFATAGAWSNVAMAYWNFRRAPSVMDVVCYTGNSDSRNLSHNLGAVPQLAIVKCRNTAQNWAVIYPSYAFDGRLNSSAAFGSTYRPNLTTYPWTTTTFSVGSNSDVNGITQTYVAYLFGDCPGVSKVGSYTGTGTTQTINCGFTGGARFVLIKRMDSTGDWFVWDTARGMIPANDPYLRLNSAAAEVTGTDYVDTTAVGFEVTSTAPDAINASGGTFIFLAIA
jgi:hypothetical protein